MVEVVLAGEVDDRTVGREVADRMRISRVVDGVLDSVEIVHIEVLDCWRVDLFEFLRDRAAGDGHRVTVEQSGIEETANDDREASLLVQVVHDLRPAGLEVAIFGVRRDFVERLDIEVDAGLRREREQVENGVGRPADRSRRAMAFSKDSRVRKSRGYGVPALLRRRVRRLGGFLVAGSCSAGGEADPSGAMPSASEIEAIVLAVNIPPQDPAPGQAFRSISSSSPALISPSAYRADALEDVLDGDVTALVFAGHDGPAVEEDGGEVGADRGHHHPGEVLVAPGDGDEPSMRSPKVTSSTESAMISREMSDAFIPSVPIEMASEMVMVPNSIGIPSVSSIPS